MQKIFDEQNPSKLQNIVSDYFNECIFSKLICKVIFQSIDMSVSRETLNLKGLKTTGWLVHKEMMRFISNVIDREDTFRS